MTTVDLMARWQTVSMDGLHVRRAREDDWDALHDAYDRAFGGIRAKDVASWRRQFRLSDIAVAEDVSDPDAPFLVGSLAVLRMRITAPGGGQLRAAVCAQGLIAPTHQKRGIYARLQAETLYIAQEFDADVFGGAPGPGAHYGYAGPAAHTRSLRIDRRRAKLLAGADDSGWCRESRPGAARPLIREIYERWQRGTPGALDRSAHFWAATFDDESFVIVHPDGYVLYDLIGDVVRVRDFCAVTPAAHRELLRCLLGHTEYAEIQLETALDDPTPLLFEDPRVTAVTGVGAELRMFVLNAPKAFERRAYRADFHGVIEVTDPYGMGSGLFEFDVSAGEGRWEPAPAGTPPDVRVGPVELASAYFGAHTPLELWRAGRIQELTAGAVTALDNALMPDRRPVNITAV
ncbi:GNAT family N-acetyltransferase [Nocardia yamanashiensis]|uniref:GNAT family N-acetyltransferase n=1 Tax=Nocardia yamanashiensis TaxID=209247 RepID=UPI00082D8849|nr:GNAT family N-acetyltransferase [Nocardia yamanashiensis]